MYYQNKGDNGNAQVDTVYLYDKETKGWSVSSETLATARIHSVTLWRWPCPMLWPTAV